MANEKQESVLPKLRAFISYSHADRKDGAQAKAVLAAVGVEAFLAHEDLDVSDEWRDRMIEELRRCDVFVPLLSASFVASKWEHQEVGFTIARSEVVIAPLSIDGATPFGFMSHVQAAVYWMHYPRASCCATGRTNAEAISPRPYPSSLRLRTFPDRRGDDAAAASVRNNQIWPAHLCKDEYLLELLRVQGQNIEPKTLRALSYATPDL